ncbi:MAG: ribosome assembly RNA-binding protein YhbY [Gammaproteobacteria bacterium]|jgi:RNA-binding protein
MALSQDQKKRFRSIAHHLKPVVMIAEKGISEGVLAELDRALEDHELIKLKVNVLERDDKTAIIAEVCQQTGATLVQAIGKVAVLYRPAKKQNPKLSNLVRFQAL